LHKDPPWVSPSFPYVSLSRTYFLTLPLVLKWLTSVLWCFLGQWKWTPLHPVMKIEIQPPQLSVSNFVSIKSNSQFWFCLLNVFK
jgi:hypothetical protein